MSVKTKVERYDKLRLLILTFLIISVVAFFWLAFRQINTQLQKFNHSVLQVVNTNKARYVQDELDDLNKLLILISKSIEAGNSSVIPLLLDSDSLSHVISSYDYFPNGKQPVSSLVHKEGLSKARTYDENLNTNDTVIFIPHERPKIAVYHKLVAGAVIFTIDLYKFHDYFEANHVDGRTYFELYDGNGICLIHPDTSRIGTNRRVIIEAVVSPSDTIIQSEFLRVPSVRNIYDVDGLFSNAKLFVYAPLILTDVEIRDIGGFSLLLSVSAIVIMLVLLYLLNRERNRSAHLAMHNLAYQKEEALLRFENLKRNVDPHFLFNALGSLQQLIGKDPSMAKTFVGKMARVYRKFLNGNLSSLATVRDEMMLAQEYYFLQKVRFGDSLLDIDFDLPPEVLSKQIPRYSIQIAIENAIKHNEFDIDHPLEIMIYLEDGMICICNNFKARGVKEESSGYGLSLISNVYDYYHVKGFSFGLYDNFYRVYLPLVSLV